MWDFAVDTVQSFVQSTPAKLWFGAFLVGFVVERLLTNAENGQKLRGYGRNVAHSIVYLVMIFLLAPSIYIPIAALRSRLGGGGLINAQIVDNSTWLNQIIIFALFYVIIDFFQYWWHRLQHRVPLLWDQHVVHHSEDAMNVTTATRHHWSEFIFQSLVISLPFGLLFKLTPAAVASSPWRSVFGNSLSTLTYVCRLARWRGLSEDRSSTGFTIRVCPSI